MSLTTRKLVAWAAAIAMVVTTFGFAWPAMNPANAATRLITGVDPGKAKVAVDWNERYHYADLEKQLKDLNEEFPDYSELEPIGKTYEDRDLWCMTITDEAYADENKSEVTVFGNIHGGEGESAACAMYSAWYLLENSANPQIAEYLKKYIVYVIPLINPDGYEQSFIYRTRENMDAEAAPDRDGDGIKFNDSYADINGDGMVGSVTAWDFENSKSAGSMGTESKDGNKNGILGDDPKNSGIDLNRNFDFLWGEDGRMDTEGPGAASELETQAVQKFIDEHQDMKGLITLHTGIQTTLYPWGYKAVEDETDQAKVESIGFMKDTAIEMSKAMKLSTRRNFYAKQSFYDYQTYSELIDYSFGKYGIHSYTIEVYNGGTYERNGRSSAYDKGMDIYDPNGDDSTVPNYCKWNNTLPTTLTKDYSHDQAITLFEIAGVDYTKLQISNRVRNPETNAWEVTYSNWADTDYGIRISYNSTQQMCGKAPDGQDEMVTGIMEGILVMMDSEEPENEPITKEEVEKQKADAAKAEAAAKYTVKGLKVTSKSKKATVTFKKTKGATAYQIQYRLKGKKWANLAKSTTKTKVTSKKLKKGKKYQFKVRTITKVAGKTVYGKWTAAKTVKIK